MEDDDALRSQVNNSLSGYFSRLQVHHKDQLALLDKLAGQLDDKDRSSLLKSQNAELDEFREMMRLIDWKIESAGQSSGGEPDASATVDR